MQRSTKTLIKKLKFLLLIFLHNKKLKPSTKVHRRMSSMHMHLAHQQAQHKKCACVNDLLTLDTRQQQQHTHE